jgi:arsenate reductase
MIYMHIRLLTFKGCPSGPRTAELLNQVLAEEGIDVPVEIVDVPDLESALKERSLGSPSIQIDGVDIELARRNDSPCHGCRLYKGDSGPTGLPPKELIREAIRCATRSKTTILFLCTGNSCRSQMAEGWARHLKPGVIEAYSAGIETHGLNPLAVKVMAEAGVDIANQKSKHVDQVKDIRFDYVVTVCGHANENCPFFPGKTKVVHVGFDDPPALAKNAATEDDALNVYRRVRDEIRRFVESLPESLPAR